MADGFHHTKNILSKLRKEFAVVDDKSDGTISAKHVKQVAENVGCLLLESEYQVRIIMSTDDRCVYFLSLSLSLSFVYYDNRSPVVLIMAISVNYDLFSILTEIH